MKDSVARPPNGFGLLDLMVVLVVASLLAALAVPAYIGFVTKAKVARAIGDVGSISVSIERFCDNNNDQLPNSLNELGEDIPLDPWGNEYVYLNIAAAGPGNSAVRMDGPRIPLNSDFDLYSRGEDGQSSGRLSAGNSRDDIVRANDGAFVGLGEDY